MNTKSFLSKLVHGLHSVSGSEDEYEIAERQEAQETYEILRYNNYPPPIIPTTAPVYVKTVKSTSTVEEQAFTPDIDVTEDNFSLVFARGEYFGNRQPHFTPVAFQEPELMHDIETLTVWQQNTTDTCVFLAVYVCRV